MYEKMNAHNSIYYMWTNGSRHRAWIKAPMFIQVISHCRLTIQKVSLIYIHHPDGIIHLWSFCENNNNNFLFFHQDTLTICFILQRDSFAPIMSIYYPLLLLLLIIIIMMIFIIQMRHDEVHFSIPEYKEHIQWYMYTDGYETRTHNSQR